MADKFDPYREALVLEEETIWSEEFDGLEASEKAQYEKALHASPEEASNIAYIRQHTGFSRQITVTQEDLDRVEEEVAG